MNEITKVEENLKIETFLKENKEFGYNIEEISKETDIQNLNHEMLLEIKDIECRIVKGIYYYIYKPQKQQFQETLDKLEKEGKIKVEIRDEIKYYEAK